MKFERFTLKEFRDERGALMPLELKDYVTWNVKRIYWSYENKRSRGGHAHKEERELFVCLRGTFKAKLHDGEKWNGFQMNAGDCVRVDPMTWHEFSEFSSDAILLAASSTNYDRSGYIEDLNEFLAISHQSPV